MVESAAVATVHPLTQAAVISVAVVMRVIGGVGVASGFLIRAVHTLSILSFNNDIITNNCYKSKNKFITNVLNRGRPKPHHCGPAPLNSFGWVWMYFITSMRISTGGVWSKFHHRNAQCRTRFSLVMKPNLPCFNVHFSVVIVQLLCPLVGEPQLSHEPADVTDRGM